MKKIRELFSKPIERTIEEVIKVDQDNEKVVLNELEEYILTDSIKSHFKEVYKEIADGQSRPREGIGIWVSGFFGSGKSSFAKILGYTVAQRKVGSHNAAGIFKDSVKDRSVSALLDSITSRIPFHAVIFDVSMERGVRTANERLTEIMYKALLRDLGYAEDFDLAELEITLEGDKRLEKFTTRFEAIHGKPWNVRRKLGLAINEASAVLHDLDPKIYPTADSYATSLAQGRADVTPNKLAERAFELAARRMPGKALIFIIDEVGQYVSRSVDKMLDLQAIIQAFGVEGKNRVERKQAVSPFWIVVTSQEKLNEVVHALDSKKIELARLQDRFRILVDLKQSDIMEVTSKRVLDKKPDAREFLGKLYSDNEGRIKGCCTLERTSRDVSIDRDGFANLYPYLPYQIDLSINIVAGLRLKRGAHRHVGGSNRTIIKQAQQMMINPRTNLGEEKPGALVTLDKVYELLYLGNLLPSETTREIDDLVKNVPGNELAHKVAKAIALLESVKDLPRTLHNLAVVLHPSVEADSLKPKIQEAITLLEKAQIIRESDEGYKLLTVQEKTWDTTRNSKDPREADRNRIKDEMIQEIFSDPRIRSYRYKDLRPFRPSLTVENRTVDSGGEFTLNVLLSDYVQGQQDRFNEARDESSAKRNELFWVVTLGDEIHELITELYRSREMVGEHERMSAQGGLGPEMASCLSDEKIRRDRLHRHLRSKIQEAIQSRTGFFQAVQKDAAALGGNLADIFHTFFDQVIPILYPKLEIGVLPIKANEVEKFLTAANLSGLPDLFRNADASRSLVVSQSGKFVPNLGAEICREIFGYLKKEHSYGNKVTGRSLETHFSGIGYAWNLESLRLGLAVLLRGGAIEITHQGRKFSNYTEPSARVPFSNTPAFRAASFSPREALDLKVLAEAARHYEEITGKDVDIEEGAIAQAFQKIAADDRDMLLSLAAKMGALKLPGAESVRNHLDWIEGILEMSADDCVKTLAGEGKSFRDARKRMSFLESVTTDENIQTLTTARRILSEQWPVLEARGIDDELRNIVRELEENLSSDEAFNKIERMKQAAKRISEAYANVYTDLFEKRKAAYDAAIEQVKGMPEWADIAADPALGDVQRSAILEPLIRRAEPELKLEPGETVCANCRATLSQLESDVAAVSHLAAESMRRVQQLAAPTEKIERIRAGSIVSGKISNEQELDAALAELKAKLLKILAQGSKVIIE